MDNIADYQIIELLSKSAKSSIYRCVDSEQNPVILKVLLEEHADSNKIARFKKEYEFTSKLESEWIINSYKLLNYKNNLAIVLEDFGATSLEEHIIKNTPISDKHQLRKALQLAILIAKSLSSVHDLNIVHKDINPTNIVYNSTTDKLKIIDFGIASEHSVEHFEPANPRYVEGTYAYISPEQTGLINRGLDYRSDYYSFGVTIYELFSGQLPFHANNSREWIHCHIAKQPIELYKVNKHIPKVLSNIVMKLMHKSAEYRYQSGYGIIKDLQTCLDNLDQKGLIDTFIIGRYDVFQRFQLPQKLYGRDKEINQLLESFESVVDGNSALVLVDGYSGIGKSALVKEIQVQIIEKRGLFTEGKFDELKKNTPYFGFVQAFSLVIKTIISESDQEVSNWREKLINALKENAQLIIDVIPELELIIGKQQEPLMLEANEAHKRFLFTFQNFVQCFARPKNPLIIFLDDMQWADAASIDIMQSLLTNNSSKSLLIVVAYRDNEVHKGHSVLQCIDKIIESDTAVTKIHLKPLTSKDIQEVVNDVFTHTKENPSELATILFQKTQGNPYFLDEFLNSLYKQELVSFNSGKGVWEFDLIKIEQLEVTENVAYLISKRIALLPDTVQDILKMASCFGTRFSLDLLTIVSGKDRMEIIDHLEIALKDSLIIALSDHHNYAKYSTEVNISYKFLHDKVFQEIYTQLSEEERIQTHLKIGRLLIEEYDSSIQKEEIFNLLEHFNEGLNLLSKIEKKEIAQLNLIACKKALASGAFKEAYSYSSSALKLLKRKDWKSEYNLSFQIYLSNAKTASLCGDYSRMEEVLNQVLEFVQDPLDKALFQEIKIQSLIDLNKQQQSISEAINLIASLGIKLPWKPGFHHLIIDLFKTRIFLRKYLNQNITRFSIMQNEQYLIAMRNMARIISVLYRTNPILFTLVVLKLVQLTVKHGIAPISPVSFTTFGLLINALFNQVQKGYILGQMGMALFDKLIEKKHWPQAFYIFNVGVRSWKEPLGKVNVDLHQCFIQAQNFGDFETMMSAAAARIHYLFRAGCELDKLLKESETYKNALQPYQQKITLSQFNVLEQMFINFKNSVPNPEILMGENYDEEKMIKYHKEDCDETSLFMIYLDKLTLAYYFGRYKEAIEIIQISKKYLKGVAGLLMFAVFNFLESLSLLAASDSISVKQKKRDLSQVHSNQKKLKKWAKHSPETFLNKFKLVEAELARVLGNHFTAEDLYFEAIDLANNNHIVHEAALAYELSSKYYLSRHKIDFAKLHINKAYKLYDIWGATAKNQVLETDYKDLILKENESVYQKTNSNSSITHYTSTRTNRSIDLETVLDASKAISSEIVLEVLLKKSLTILMEHAGAQKGVLLIENASTKTFSIEAEGLVKKDKIKATRTGEEMSDEKLPTSVIRYVERTGQMIILHNAHLEGNFMKDQYIHQHNVKSLLAIPIIKQAKVSGILYLENNLSPEVFTSDRVDVLTILCTQMAISLENALLYNTLEQKVKERTREIENARDQLTELIATKDKFFSIIGHDLRGPIGGTNQLIEILSDEENIYSKEETKQLLLSLGKTTKQSYKLLENLLTWARSQRNEIVYSPAEYNLYKIVESNITLFEQTASNKQVSLLNKVPADLKVFADKDMIDTVIRNLINNAIKYTKEGGEILLEASIQLGDTVVSILDNGIGMNDRIRKNLFEIDNKQAYRKGTTGETGTGLGLILCKEFVEKHNGKIWVESKENEGSNFFFSIPFNLP